MLAGRRQASDGVFVVFPLDILLWQIWLKNLYAQITPMRALPLQTTLLTHSGALKKPLQPDLKVKRSFDFLPLTVDFTCC